MGIFSGDVIGAAPGYPSGANRGRVYLFAGGPAIATRAAADADLILTGEDDDNRFGSTGRTLDVDGDGVQDLLVSALLYPAGTKVGRSYIFTGGTGLADMDAGAAPVILTGENAGDYFGF